jgi:MoaA/NifB/PqqE/SkfB family radical SAM enzyme
MNESGNNLWEGLQKNQTIDLITELHEQRISHLYVSGGEPLLYDGIDEVLQHAYSLGMKITLATNGVEIEKHIHIIKNCVDVVSMSLDGIGETHDFFRGVSGSFDHALKMLDLLNLHGVKTKISAIVWKRNVDQLEEMIALVKSKGVMKINLNILVPVGRAKENSEIEIPSSKYPAIYKRISKLIGKYKDDSFVIEIKRRNKLNKDSIACPGGKTIFHINAHGKVSPCSWLSKLDDEDEFSLYWEKGNLDACFNACNKIDKILEGRTNKYSYSGCPALANIHKGDFFSDDPLNEMVNSIDLA